MLTLSARQSKLARAAFPTFDLSFEPPFATFTFESLTPLPSTRKESYVHFTRVA